MVRKKILLAEDDMDDQKLFEEFFHHRDDILLLSFVENGEELLQFLKASGDDGQLPDLIILDQNMPKKNGLQTLQLLKEENRYTNIPVVIYSTYADQQLIKDASNLGASLIVAKPVTREGYHQMLDELLTLVTQ